MERKINIVVKFQKMDNLSNYEEISWTKMLEEYGKSS